MFSLLGFLGNSINIIHLNLGNSFVSIQHLSSFVISAFTVERWRATRVPLLASDTRILSSEKCKFIQDCNCHWDGQQIICLLSAPVFCHLATFSNLRLLTVLCCKISFIRGSFELALSKCPRQGVSARVLERRVFDQHGNILPYCRMSKT